MGRETCSYNGPFARIILSFKDRIEDVADQRAWEMQVFLQVAKLGSFSAAGRAVAMTASSIAKLVSRIEHRLSVRLIERSTRRLRLTAEGELYRERAEALLDDLDSLDTE